MRARHLQRRPPPPSPLYTHTHTHTQQFQMPGHTYTLPYSPLPQPASAPPPDPVIPSSPLRLITPSPPICHCSPDLHLLSPLSRSRSLPAGRLSVDVKVGGMVSNSPSDTGASEAPDLSLHLEDFSPSSAASLLIGRDGSWCILGLQPGPGLGSRKQGGDFLCCHDAECQA